jgi:hypothetical protein
MRARAALRQSPAPSLLASSPKTATAPETAGAAPSLHPCARTGTQCGDAVQALVRVSREGDDGLRAGDDRSAPYPQG